MLGQDPPRRPPQRNALSRSKSCQGPTRRKRGREVLEDITWIVNHPSSWQQHDRATATSRMNDDGVEESLEDNELQAIAGPSSARLLEPPHAPAAFPPTTSSRHSNLQSVNMARARSDTSLPLLDSTLPPSFNARLQLQPNSSNSLLDAPRASVSRITNLDSSSPPSSPHSASRYGYLGYGGGGGSSNTTINRNAGLGLSRAATLPYLTVGTSSSSSSLATTSRRSSNATSPSLRAPPPLRRTSSSSSVSSMDGTASTSTPATSPSLLSSPFLSSRTLARASTMPTFVNPWSNTASNTPQQGSSSSTARILPIPTIQREMPSPERKRSRRGSRVIEEDDDDEGEDANEGPEDE